MAGRGGPTPAPGPSYGYKSPIQSRIAAGMWLLEVFVTKHVLLIFKKYVGRLFRPSGD